MKTTWTNEEGFDFTISLTGHPENIEIDEITMQDEHGLWLGVEGLVPDSIIDALVYENYAELENDYMNYKTDMILEAHKHGDFL